ncbi:uncharacterized protein LOC110845880 isoform X2 [Folsomia candida]|uniref:uncharacterized protein LOC110845880 isoform X2 n=1 Tax=Folsomia candida TaxID=158441 RepID=UPI0016054AE5|nr:uncharacterized protein LOC110845880 isoform X2 [Folsomia candida]
MKLYRILILSAFRMVLTLDNAASKPQSTNKLVPEGIQTQSTGSLWRKKPHIEARFFNGDANSSVDLQIVNSALNLNRNIKTVELICKASHPIKWEFLVNEVSIPILEVQYRRVVQRLNRSDDHLDDEIYHLHDPNNSFEGRVVLRGLLESQSGKYSCRFYNARFSNNSYSQSTNVSVFIPGERIFTTVSHIQYINSIDNSVVISCPASDSRKYVTLHKLNEEVFNKTKKIEWEQVPARFSPSTGFELIKVSKFQQLFGTYKCVAFGSETSITVHIADSAWKQELYDPLLKNQESCWEAPACMKLMRSKRMECFCRNSFALFLDSNGTETNRRGNCSDIEAEMENLSTLTKKDWRVEEFLRNGEIDSNVCFRDEVRGLLIGTGSEGNNSFPLSSSSSLQSTRRVNLTITLDGLPEWASGFQIGIEHNNTSFPDFSHHHGDGGTTNQRKRISFLDQEPTTTQLFPLAHIRAVWRNVIIDTKEVSRIHVYQPDSFSFEWFQVSSEISANAATTTTANNGTLSIVGDEQDVGESCRTTILIVTFLVLAAFAVVIVLLYALIYLHRQRSPKLIKYYKCGIERSSRCFVNPND